MSKQSIRIRLKGFWSSFNWSCSSWNRWNS